jgi:hypothetical protein
MNDSESSKRFLDRDPNRKHRIKLKQLESSVQASGTTASRKEFVRRSQNMLEELRRVHNKSVLLPSQTHDNRS